MTVQVHKKRLSASNPHVSQSLIPMTFANSEHNLEEQSKIYTHCRFQSSRNGY